MRTYKLAAFSLITLAALASAASAQTLGVQPHGEQDVVLGTPSTSTRSRAEVLSELQQSVANVARGEVGAPVLREAASTLSRAQVRQSVLQAAAQGQILHGEALVPVAGTAPAALRPVRSAQAADTVVAIQNGEADGYGQTLRTPSTLSRAEVIAELRQARSHSGLALGDAGSGSLQF